MSFSELSLRLQTIRQRQWWEWQEITEVVEEMGEWCGTDQRSQDTENRDGVRAVSMNPTFILRPNL